MIRKTLTVQLVVLCTFFQLAAFAQTGKIKFGQGLKVVAADTSISLKFQFRMQHLFTAEQGLNDGDKFKSNYLVRRARIKFSGHVFNPKLTYKVELGISNRDISISSEDGNGGGASRIILDAVLKYNFVKSWTIWVGQTKLPGNRERVISSADLQFVDRSMLNSKFNIDRDMGIQLHGKYKLGNSFTIKPKFAWTMGEGRNITKGNFGGYNYTAHLDLLPMGEFEGKKDDYISSDLNRQPKPKLSIGSTFNFNDDAVRQQGQLGSFVLVENDSTGVYVTNDLTSLMFDLMFKYKGLSIMSEYAMTSATDKIGGLSKNYNTGYGFNVQFAYLFTRNFEIAGRYTTLMPDDINYSAVKETSEYTLALSKYIVGHNLKVQTDVAFIEEANSDGTMRFRFQVEMQF